MQGRFVVPLFLSTLLLCYRSLRPRRATSPMYWRYEKPGPVPRRRRSLRANPSEPRHSCRGFAGPPKPSGRGANVRPRRRDAVKVEGSVLLFTVHFSLVTCHDAVWPSEKHGVIPVSVQTSGIMALSGRNRNRKTCCATRTFVAKTERELCRRFVASSFSFIFSLSLKTEH